MAAASPVLAAATIVKRPRVCDSPLTDSTDSQLPGGSASGPRPDPGRGPESAGHGRALLT